MSAHETPEQTLARLDEIDARAAAAEPGPWSIQRLQLRELATKRPFWVFGGGPDKRGCGFAFGDDDGNARFIAAAREDVPALVALVRSLLAERDEARANYQFMVERAADAKLDGYRELGARAAAAENRADELRRQLEVARAHWRCFHCGEAFDDAAASEHFGPWAGARPAWCVGMLQAISGEFERHGVHRNVHNAASVRMLVERITGAEAARWAARLIEEFPDAPSDGSGCESGDPLDVAVARLRSLVDELRDALAEQLAAARLLAEQAAAVERRACYVLADEAPEAAFVARAIAARGPMAGPGEEP